MSEESDGDPLSDNLLEVIDVQADELEQAENESKGMTYRMAMRMWGGSLPQYSDVVGAKKKKKAKPRPKYSRPPEPSPGPQPFELNLNPDI